MKIKVPKQLRVLTHTYDVKLDSRQVFSAGTCGITKHLFQEIILDDKNLPPSELNQVFLHEYIHTLERHFCVKLEESDVERLSEGLAILLFDSLGIELDWSDIKSL
jgi:hypothetical protein